ncbi:MAG: alpha/beta fold hydrolase [Chloroflexota bacterium]
MPFITTTRGEVHYKDYRGDDFDSIPFVLVHGAGSQYNDFHVKIRRGLRTIALDLPAHGKSPRSSETISIENYAQDMIAFLDALALEKIILVGHSMGGGIAQQIALDYSQYLQGLVLIATGAKLSVNQAIIDGIINTPEATARRIVKWSWGKNIDEKMLQQGVEHLLETPIDVIQADYIACDNFDVRDRLHEIHTPTLVIAGALDKMTQLEWNQELADKIRNSTLKIFEDNGHQVHVEQVEAVTELLQSWVSQL